jgi:hypothetical protein
MRFSARTVPAGCPPISIPVVPQSGHDLDGGVFGPVAVLLTEQEPGWREGTRDLDQVTAHDRVERAPGRQHHAERSRYVGIAYLA